MARGQLLIIGGAEDKSKKCKILQWFIDQVNRRGEKIILITTATKAPEEVGREYLKIFKHLGGLELDVLNINSRLDANQRSVINSLRQADGIFFSGGDQLRITSTIGGTLASEAIYDAYEDGAVIAGTSAGAAIMSETMIVEGEDDESPRRCTVKMAPGLGLLKNVVVDMHFSQRGRQGRLLAAIGQNPNILGIGIDENTAVSIDQDHRVKVLGDRTVWIVDGREISYSNVSERAPDEVLVLADVRLHVLPAGYEYDLQKRLVIGDLGFREDKEERK